MAEIIPMNPEIQKWIDQLPEKCREKALQYPPNKLYRLKNGNRVVMYGYDENTDGTCTTCQVIVSGQYNFVLFERRVFSVSFDDLEECDLPGPEERLGSMGLTPEQASEFDKAMKEELNNHSGENTVE